MERGEFFDAFGVPLFPELDIALEEGLSGVIFVVEGVASAGAFVAVFEGFEASDVSGEFFFAGVSVSGDADGGRGVSVAAGAGDIADGASAWDLAIGVEFEGSFDGFIGDAEAGVASGDEGDEAGAADRGIGVLGFWGVAPGFEAIFFLGGEDEIDGFLEDGGDAIVLDGAVGFGEGEGREAMIIHGVADVAGFFVGAFEEEIE